MTTIAYRWGVLAADSRIMRGGWKATTEAQKLRRLPDGTVAGAAGDYCCALAFIDWLADETGDRPSLGEATVVRLLKDGSVTVYEDNGSYTEKPDFEAWGSGGPVARAAMYMGADAAKAVEIAALIDDSTGGKIVSMKCEI